MRQFGLARFAATLVAGVLMAPCMASAEANSARFDYVEYRATAEEAAVGMFRNPILPGFHPDPTITAYKDEYLLVTSTFTWMPGFRSIEARIW